MNRQNQTYANDNAQSSTVLPSDNNYKRSPPPPVNYVDKSLQSHYSSNQQRLGNENATISPQTSFATSNFTKNTHLPLSNNIPYGVAQPTFARNVVSNPYNSLILQNTIMMNNLTECLKSLQNDIKVVSNQTVAMDSGLKGSIDGVKTMISDSSKSTGDFNGELMKEVCNIQQTMAILCSKMDTLANNVNALETRFTVQETTMSNLNNAVSLLSPSPNVVPVEYNEDEQQQSSEEAYITSQHSTEIIKLLRTLISLQSYPLDNAIPSNDTTDADKNVQISNENRDVAQLSEVIQNPEQKRQQKQQKQQKQQQQKQQKQQQKKQQPQKQQKEQNVARRTNDNDRPSKKQKVSVGSESTQRVEQTTKDSTNEPKSTKTKLFKAANVLRGSKAKRAPSVRLRETKK